MGHPLRFPSRPEPRAASSGNTGSGSFGTMHRVGHSSISSTLDALQRAPSMSASPKLSQRDLLHADPDVARILPREPLLPEKRAQRPQPKRKNPKRDCRGDAEVVELQALRESRIQSKASVAWLKSSHRNSCIVLAHYYSTMGKV